MMDIDYKAIRKHTLELFPTITEEEFSKFLILCNMKHIEEQLVRREFDKRYEKSKNSGKTEENGEKSTLKSMEAEVITDIKIT